MKKYYTTLDSVNGQFIGTVFDAVTNQEVYKTKLHQTQVQVTQDITTFLQTANPPKADPVTPQQYINTLKPVTITGAVRKCCGR